MYVTNGGYGGALLSIGNGLPMVVAGVHEGKNEISARIGYFKLGINLKTETPTPEQLRKSVETVMKDPSFRMNVKALSEEFRQYHPGEILAGHIANLVNSRRGKAQEKARPRAVYQS